MKAVLKGVLTGLAASLWLTSLAMMDAQAKEPPGIQDEIGRTLDRCLRQPGACHHMPGVCKRSDLSDKFQALCDRIRFRGEPHYIVANIAPNGGIRSYHLIRTDTGQEVLTAYPFGLARGIASDDVRERKVRMTYGQLRSFWHGRPVPEDTPRRRRVSVPRGPKVTPPDSSYIPAVGLQLGWSPSVGPSTTECIDFTLGTPGEVEKITAFSSADAATSSAEQINVSATVKGAYGAFKATDSFSYSDKYQASANSGFQYWNVGDIYRLNTAATGTFTDQGQDALNAGTFSATCGSEYMASVEGGFFATISMSWNSSSSSTSSSISDSLNASVGLETLQSAATVATSSSSAQAAFNITIISYGGGLSATPTEEPPSELLSDAFASVDKTTNQAYYAQCAGTLSNPPAPDSSGCNNFSTAMGSGATDALDAFTNWVNSITSGSNVAAFALFPNGVAGVTNQGIVTNSMPKAANASDILEPYQTQLEQYTDVLNQLATLQNRASHLYGAVYNTPYDPVSLPGNAPDVSLSSVLEFLDSAYSTARATVLGNLSNCLGASSANVAAACAPVTQSSAAGIKTAYDWINANVLFPQDQQLLLQNTIALQYSGLYTNSNGSQWPQDVVYYDPLPDWGGIQEFFLIGGKAGLVGFADAAYVNGGVTLQSPSFVVLALNPTADLSQVISGVYTTQNTQPPGLWFGWVNNQQAAATNDASQPLAWLGGSTFCSPTAENPCEIWWGIDSSFSSAYPQSFRMDGIPGLFPPTGE